MPAAKPTDDGPCAPEGANDGPSAVLNARAAEVARVQRELDTFAGLLDDGWVESEPGIYYRTDYVAGA